MKLVEIKFDDIQVGDHLFVLTKKPGYACTFEFVVDQIEGDEVVNHAIDEDLEIAFYKEDGDHIYRWSE